MENENSVPKIKLKKIFKIPLIVISIIVFSLVSLGVFVYFIDGDTKEIYNNILSDVSNELIVLLDRGNINKISGNIKLNMKSEMTLLPEEQAIYDLINALSIGYEMEVDTKNDKTNISLDAKYAKENFINLDLNNLNKETFINLGNLFDKKIKVNNEDLWFYYISVEEKKAVIKELSQVIQNSLKEEYFNKKKEVLKISDKDIYTTRHTLELNAKSLYDLKISLIDGIKNSNKILEILAELKNIDKSEVINEINSIRNDLEVNKEEYFKIDIYLNLFTKNLVKLEMSVKEEKITFTETDKDYYDIIYTENNISTLIGNLIVEEDIYKLTYKDKDIDLALDLTSKAINLNIKYDDIKFNVNITKNNETISYNYEIILKEEDIELKLIMNGTIENINKVSDKIITNYINIDEMTDEDYAVIYERLMQNKTLMTLIEDISYVYSGLLEYEEDMSNNIETPII